MNTNLIVCENHEQGKVTRVGKKHKENSTRTLFLITLFILSANFAIAECTNYIEAFSKHQLVIKGMMDLNFQGKMSAEVGNVIGKRLQEAQKPLDAGEYNKACEMYDLILDDYNFDKSFGEAPASETKESSKQNSSNISDEASTGAKSSSTSSDAASSSSDSANAQPNEN